MSGYYEQRAYSPILDAESVRLSMFNQRGDEFFMVIPDDGTARKYRERKAEALQAICEAMSIGLDPGEVRIV